MHQRTSLALATAVAVVALFLMTNASAQQLYAVRGLSSSIDSANVHASHLPRHRHHSGHIRHKSNHRPLMMSSYLRPAITTISAAAAPVSPSTILQDAVTAIPLTTTATHKAKPYHARGAHALAHHSVTWERPSAEAMRAIADGQFTSPIASLDDEMFAGLWSITKTSIRAPPMAKEDVEDDVEDDAKDNNSDIAFYLCRAERVQELLELAAESGDTVNADATHAILASACEGTLPHAERYTEGAFDFKTGRIYSTGVQKFAIDIENAFQHLFPFLWGEEGRRCDEDMQEAGAIGMADSNTVVGEQGYVILPWDRVADAVLPPSRRFFLTCSRTPDSTEPAWLVSWANSRAALMAPRRQ